MKMDATLSMVTKIKKKKIVPLDLVTKNMGFGSSTWCWLLHFQAIFILISTLIPLSTKLFIYVASIKMQVTVGGDGGFLKFVIL